MVELDTDVPRLGEVAQTLGAVTSSATCTVLVQGAVAQTLGITCVATATAKTRGVVNATLGAVACLAGDFPIQCVVNATLGDITPSIRGFRQFSYAWPNTQPSEVDTEDLGEKDISIS